jgi:hypothetical protein
MHVSATQLLSNTTEVAWIDTTGEFSAALFSKILQEHLKQETPDYELHSSLSLVLSRIKILRVFDTEGLADAVDEIRTEYRQRTLRPDGKAYESVQAHEDHDNIQRNESNADSTAIRLVVVDELAPLFIGQGNKGSSYRSLG